MCVRVRACVRVFPERWRNYGAEQYGPDSVCLYQRSAFVMEQCTRKLTYPDWGSGCYKVLLMLIVSICAPHTHAYWEPFFQVWCSGGGLVVFVQDRSFLCVHKGQLLSVSVRVGDWVYNGILVCPACEVFCDDCPLPHQLPATNASRSKPIGQCPPPARSL